MHHEQVSVSQFGDRLTQIGVSEETAQRAQSLLCKEVFNGSISYQHEEDSLADFIYRMVDCWLCNLCPCCEGDGCWRCKKTGNWVNLNT